MDSIVNRLTEIESAAEAIVQHADEEKAQLDREFDEKRKKFDEDLEAKTQARIHEIQNNLEKRTASMLGSQNDASSAAIEALQKEYGERHTEYAHSILERITEV